MKEILNEKMLKLKWRFWQ